MNPRIEVAIRVLAGIFTGQLFRRKETARTRHSKSLFQLKAMDRRIADIGQSVYDEWDEENTEVFAGGGICHLIAEEVYTMLYKDGFECSVMSSSHEQHVFVVAQVKEGIYMVDIPWSVYERGGGFTWYKLKNITFHPNDVVFYCVDKDPEKWEEYIED